MTWKGIVSWVLAEAGVEDRGDLVHVPYRRRDGTVQNWKVFMASGRTWWLKAGRALIPFGVERLPVTPYVARGAAVLIQEGESDTLAAHEAFVFHADEVADYYVSIGLPGAGSWRREWRAYFEIFPLIYIVGDGDDAGRRMARTVLRDLPWARVVRMPEGEDARSLLQREGPRALDALLDDADVTAQVDAAFRRARTLDEAEALLRGHGSCGC